MAELKEGTLRITVTEAALQKLGLFLTDFVNQCDKCLTFVAREEVGYRDESRTECRDCHEHDWRCEEDFGEDNLPEEGAPLCDYHADSPGWDECTDGQECSHRSKEENAIVAGDCPKCGRVMAIAKGGAGECRYNDCKNYLNLTRCEDPQWCGTDGRYCVNCSG